MRRAGCALLSLVSVFALVGEAEAAPLPGSVTVIAHRCNGSIYTEQTTLACVRAAATGAEILDGDVRFTSTGNPVMLHNADLGVFNCPTKLIAEVSTTTAGKCLSDSNQNIMTLYQLKDLVIATGTRVSIEPKVRPSAAQWDAIDSRLASIKGRVILNSFDPATLGDAAARGYTPLALNTANDLAPAQVPPGVSIVIENAANVDPASVAALTGAGIETWCYACNDPATWQAMVDAGVTGFATDDHDAAEEWLS